MTPSKSKVRLDYKRMVDEIDALVETDFCFDMDSRFVDEKPQWTQDEAKQMAHLLGRIYSIAHCNTCTACQGTYSISN